ncbi:hypothetical protein KKE68_05995 [Patescibacteria group bacterium]|nr:hypothetical protein [Patescibacteria group bacterium]
MLFSKLSEYFERLEQTASRLAMIDILSDLFKHTSVSDIDKVIYLSQGRVAPFFAPIEIGMADKTVSQSLADAYKVSKEHVWDMYQKQGDMGKVAERLSSNVKAQMSKLKFISQNSKLTVKNVFDTLREIAKTSGEGTVEKRIGLFSELLKALDPVSVKHLVRMALGRTRLGVGDPTILDGLALAFLGDRTKRKLLEKAYNETSDLGLIGKTFLEGGLEAVQKLGVTVGRPIRSELCERLPNPE